MGSLNHTTPHELVDFGTTYHRLAYLFSIDLQKAHNTRDTAVLFRDLSHLRLLSHFLSFINSLHVNPSMHLYVICVVDRFVPVCSSGRQGCPLALQLFIYVIELFHRFLATFLELLRFITSRFMTCCADDITIFLQDPSVLDIVLPLLEDIASVSNERLNPHECAIIPFPIALEPSPSHFHNIPHIRRDAADRILSPSRCTMFTWYGLINKVHSRVKKRDIFFSCTPYTLCE